MSTNDNPSNGKVFIPAPEEDPLDNPVIDLTSVLQRLGIKVLRPYCPVDDIHTLVFLLFNKPRKQSFCLTCKQFRSIRSLYIHEPR